MLPPHLAYRADSSCRLTPGKIWSALCSSSFVHGGIVFSTAPRFRNFCKSHGPWSSDWSRLHTKLSGNQHEYESQRQKRPEVDEDAANRWTTCIQNCSAEQRYRLSAAMWTLFMF